MYKVETENLMGISAGVGGFSDGGSLSKKNYFDEEDFNTNRNGNESTTTSGEEVKRWNSHFLFWQSYPPWHLLPLCVTFA